MRSCAHKVHAGDLLGDRVLDLQAGVHFQEVEPRVVAGAFEQKLDRSGVPIAGSPRDRDRGLAHAPAAPASARRRRFFDDFLMSPLKRTLALEQVHDGP